MMIWIWTDCEVRSVCAAVTVVRYGHGIYLQNAEWKRLKCGFFIFFLENKSIDPLMPYNVCVICYALRLPNAYTIDTLLLYECVTVRTCMGM